PSILSGLAVEELRERGKRAAELRAISERLKAPRRPVAGDDLQPMLAEPRSDPFDDPEWLFELKYDGFRSIVSRDGSRPRIFYRRGGTDPRRRARRRPWPRPLRQRARARARGHRREARPVRIPERAVSRLAEGPHRPRRRLRGGGFHPGGGLADWFRLCPRRGAQVG